MVLDETWISLLLMVGTMMLVGGCRKLTQRHMYTRRPRMFLLEVFATFQICACTNELRLLANVQPKPHVALTLTYIFTVLHGLTLTGSTCNPCGTLQQILDGGISVKQGGLKIGAQFAGAVLARIYMHRIWSMGIINVHSEALSEGCCNPIQTTETQAFCIELLFSTVFQLTILQFESIKPRLRVHLIALLITMLVYGDKAIMPPPPSLADDFDLFQELVKRVADTLLIPLEEVKDTDHQLFDIQSSCSNIGMIIDKTIVLIMETDSSKVS
ncbi:Aquaporin-11 [Chelonia mydas]|uniref:Aquaporin-11 n=1 Tax=Chelonia mydas TaxID=8469 RepID=M7AZN7_CHEMY|nr:Aquaporin-11 [Chelonia mydas]